MKKEELITEKEKTELYLRNIVANLPECPGCYQYLDETGTIIYVGKAKNLKRRVYSYFSKENGRRCAVIGKQPDKKMESKIQYSAQRRKRLSQYLHNQRVLAENFPNT